MTLITAAGRVIDYTVTVRPQHGPVRAEKSRLATSLLDHRQAPLTAGRCLEGDGQRGQVRFVI
ncbi:hypothetical protein ACH4ND_32100 [Streptomyces sp. NPDC017179]|uniref:hypothetical protein n=1 Tax=Streptomyces sp. NPDC017179 TaxID=3364979 RepID=UPI0037BA5CD2